MNLKTKITTIVAVLLTSFGFSGEAYGATQIFRSVGPSATAVLTNDDSHIRNVAVVAGEATFSSALPDNIGVGDAVLIDTGGTDQTIDAADMILFIHGRIDSTHYTLRTHTGAVPGDIATNDTYQIYRAHTSLANAENGIKNTSIPMTFNGGNRDLVANNEQWNIACYANGTTADTTAVRIEGWISGSQNFVKMYTPTSLVEVGTSQRHSGKWDDNKYRLSPSTQALALINQNSVVDGLQIDSRDDYAVSIALSGNETVLANSIVKSSTHHDQGAAPQVSGNRYFIYNNIFYDLMYGVRCGANGTVVYLYNNTISNCDVGVADWYDDIRAVNNISVNNGVNYSAIFAPASFNNISSDGFAPGANSKINTNVNFVDEANYDFHLAQSDTAARGAGANLTNDANLPITTDIDGQLRNATGDGWDIGADEGTVEFAPTVMQSGGDYSSLAAWNAGVKTDLVADSTRVFSHGGVTGVIADDASVTGLASGAMATVVHATIDQILLENISGTFQSGEVVEASAGNSVTLLDNGNPASAVAKIDGEWTVADTAAVSVGGWETGVNNYIRIYTTEVARHQGKWDDGKYRLVNDSSNSLIISEANVVIDGLLLNNYSSAQFARAILFHTGNDVNGTTKTISNCIVKSEGTGANKAGVYLSASEFSDYNIYNNIIYDFPSGMFLRTNELSNVNVSNNTIFNASITGIRRDIVVPNLRNNVIQNCGTDYWSSSGYTSTSFNNISSDATAPGANSKINTTVNFVSTEAGSEDFHLSENDAAAKDSGVDLSVDANLAFSTDIDGQSRLAGLWDIGADEAPTKIYRSVGPSATAVLADDGAHARNVTVVGGVATFSAALATNIGVGDVVLVDTDNSDAINSADTLLFIHGRIDSTHYTLRTHTGAIPTDIAINDTYAIYRAHTSLRNAESGLINSTLSDLGFVFNGGNRDLVANNEQWNIATYANGTTADTRETDIDGWVTGPQNYIRIYTPTSLAEVGTSQRHSGKWDESKYYMAVNGRLSLYTPITVNDDYLRVDGLQINAAYDGLSGDDFQNGVVVKSTGAVISNNIIRKSLFDSAKGISFTNLVNDGTISLSNNIIYDFYDGLYSEHRWDSVRQKAYVYNNTIINSSIIIRYNTGNGADVYLVNNLVKNSRTNFFIENINASHNASSDATADDVGGANNKIDQIFSFIDESSNDFHLAPSDTAAKNAGADLSADANLPITTDIDGAPRDASINAFDIGADETATQIFRSVGPGATTALTNDSSHARNVTVTAGEATFSSALPDNIGVGDAVLIDTGGTDQTIDAADTILFIHGRTDSTHYTLRTHTGAVPGDIAVNDTYTVYRAHTSLANAENGTINSALSGLGFAFNGGDRDLVTNNEQWNIACYANGTTADTTAVTVDGWATGVQNFIKVYTPVRTNEVGVSQRHSGKWDDAKYRIETTNTAVVTSLVNYIRMDGLQVKLTGTTGMAYGIAAKGSASADITDIYVSNNIVQGVLSGTGSAYGINSFPSTNGSNRVNIANNIVYNFNINNSAGISTTRLTARVNNNTVYNCSTGFYKYSVSGSVVLKNNIAQSCIDGYYKIDSPSSDNNISDIDGDAPNATFAGGFAEVEFIDEANGDFHLAQSDTAARGSGTNLTNDANLPITTDIDGQIRNPVGDGWDIGADEGMVEFVSTVMQSGGDYSSLASWEAGVQTDLVADTTRVFSHGGVIGVIADDASVTGLTSGATATVVHSATDQILLENISGTFVSGEILEASVGNSVTLSDNGNPASAVAKIDGEWTVADGSLSVSGWTTGADNYIRIYTTPIARHGGKWNDTKYRTFTAVMAAGAEYARIDGLQFNTVAPNVYFRQISFAGINTSASDLRVSNSIMIGDLSNLTGNHYGRGIYTATNYEGNYSVWNNVFIGFTTPQAGTSTAIGNYGGTLYSYNNTFYKNDIALRNDTGEFLHAKNNIAQNCILSCYAGNFEATSSNNISSDATAPGTNSKINTTVDFVSTEAGSEDFHLADTDIVARDAGADLSSYGFSTDIDGNQRLSGLWDIGADEAATRIYRSVGPSMTDALDNDSSHSKNITVTSGVAIFSDNIPDNVGVGDVVLIDTDNNDTIGSADTLLFIHGRTDSMHYTLRTQTGAMPTDIATNDTYSIYRAHTSLSNAEAGTKNASIPITFSGGNRDLIANNEQWNIAAYANGTTADAAGINVSGWNTSEQSFIKMYTPINTNEVGVPQRHDGKWSNEKYHRSSGITINDKYVHMDGLQMHITASSGYVRGVRIMATSGITTISNNIIRATLSGTFDEVRGIVGFSGVSSVHKIYNNIVYDWNLGVGIGIVTDANSYAYNNTVYNNSIGYYRSTGGSHTLKNNIAQNCTNGYSGSFNASSDFNISDISDDAPNATFTGGFAEVQFADEANYDFHLAPSDTAAKNKGLNLSADAYLAFQDDIDGDHRDMNWSIGADEGPGVTVDSENLPEGSKITLQTTQTDKLTDGLVGMWSFDGPDVDLATNTAYDRSPIGTNHGTIVGATPTIGKKGQGIEFDGVDDSVSVPSPAGGLLDFTGDFSISFWMNMDVVSGTNVKIFGKHWSNSYTIQRHNVGVYDTQLAFFVDGSGVHGGSSKANRWTLISGTYDVDTQAIVLYQDGVAVASGTVGPPEGDSGNNLTFGGAGFDGRLDEIRMYNRTLTPEEVKNLYQMSQSKISN